MFEDEIEYCEICEDPLTDEDDVYEGMCNWCGDKNPTEVGGGELCLKTNV